MTTYGAKINVNTVSLGEGNRNPSITVDFPVSPGITCAECPAFQGAEKGAFDIGMQCMKPLRLDESGQTVGLQRATVKIELSKQRQMEGIAQSWLNGNFNAEDFVGRRLMTLIG